MFKLWFFTLYRATSRDQVRIPPFERATTDCIAPAAAALAYALFDASGLRLRAPPITPERALDGWAGPTTVSAGAVDIGVAAVVPVQ